MNALQGITCRFCGQSASRLILTALLQDAGCETNNPADACYARDEEGEPPLPHDFTAATSVDRSGEAGETRSGSTEGESAVPSQTADALTPEIPEQ